MPAPFHWPDGRKAALSLTFDDARISNPDIGFPLFEKHGVRATWFVITNGGPLDSRIDAWKKAVAFGHEMGNHSMKHPCSGNFPFTQRDQRDTESYTLERMEAELLEASAEIKKKLGVTPRTFAYPCGENTVGRGKDVKSYIPVVAKHFLAGRGYPSEWHNDPAYCDPAHLFGVSFDCRGWDYVQPLIDQAIQGGGWLVFVGHDIGQGNPRQLVDPAMLEKVFAYAKDPRNGLWLDTMGNVAEYLVKRRGG
jgi:peptidoglycan/xylan/chitin deacetylase (PgdA/CDA1 family)